MHISFSNWTFMTIFKGILFPIESGPERLGNKSRITEERENHPIEFVDLCLGHCHTFHVI